MAVDSVFVWIPCSYTNTHSISLIAELRNPPQNAVSHTLSSFQDSHGQVYAFDDGGSDTTDCISGQIQAHDDKHTKTDKVNLNEVKYKLPFLLFYDMLCVHVL